MVLHSRSVQVGLHVSSDKKPGVGLVVGCVSSNHRVKEMERGEKKTGSKRRSKSLQVGFDSGDDEPIGSLFKLKTKRNPKKVKTQLDEVGEKCNDSEVLAEKFGVVNEDLGGMDDTLASFRKKLKGPKKDSGSEIAVGRSLSIDVIGSSGQLLDGSLENGALAIETENGQETCRDGSAGTISKGLENSGKEKIKRTKRASKAKKTGGIFGVNDALGVRGFGDNSVQIQKECDLGSEKGSRPRLNDNFEDSLSAFFQKAQSGSMKKTHSYLRSEQRRETHTPKNELGSEDVSDDSLPVVLKNRTQTPSNLTQKSLEHDDDLCSGFARDPINSTQSQNKIEVQQASDLNMQESQLSVDTMKELLSTSAITDLDTKPVDSMPGDHCEAILEESVPVSSLQMSQSFLGPCSSKSRRLKEGKVDKQTGCINAEPPVDSSCSDHHDRDPVEPLSVNLKDDCSLWRQELTSEVPNSVCVPVKVEEICQHAVDQESIVIPSIEQKSCSAFAEEVQEACLNGDLISRPCEDISQETLKQLTGKILDCSAKTPSQYSSSRDKKMDVTSITENELDIRPSLKSISDSQLESSCSMPGIAKKEEINVDCSEQVTGTCTKETDIAPISSQKENPGFSEGRLSPVTSCFTFHQIQTSGDAPKETLVQYPDYLSGSGEANGVSSPSTTPDRCESFADDTGHLPDTVFTDKKQSAVHRAVRKAKKRRDEDMAYEGDADWEMLIQKQGLFETHLVGDSDQSLRPREKFNSSLNTVAEIENWGAAAVSAGLKARVVGPVEKIKFKEVLKRRGGLQEYLHCRNRILSLWSKDVTRVLPLTDCGVTASPSTHETPRASLIREIYAFLDQSGYINVGAASAKDRTEPTATHEFKLLEEKIFGEKAGTCDADTDDGVSFILGGVRSSEVGPGAKNGVLLDDQSQGGATKDWTVASLDTLDLATITEPDEGHADELHKNGFLDAKPPNRMVHLDVLSSNLSGDALDTGAVPIITPEPTKHLYRFQSASSDDMDGNHGMQCDSEGRKRIIVIGAGPAGLTAARHLQRQGFSVTILEARSRIGGRVYTDRSSLSVPVDLGASIITGVEADVATERRADPSSLICAQLGLELTVLNSDCPLYDTVTGKKVPADLDEALEAEYNSLLDDMLLLVAQKGEQAMEMSLEDGLEYALKRRRMARLSRDYMDSELHNAADALVAEKTIDDGKVYGNNRFREEILSPLERRVMDWHFANLEYGCAALLEKVSLPHWNQDDLYGGFGGAHCMIKGGYSSVVESLGEGLCIHLNHVVTDILYHTKDCGENGDHGSRVKVSTSSGREFQGDGVLITVPLGCLKAETIRFSPPLPEWKNLSIQRLGFGVLNKVVLEFPEVFWDDSVDYFGATAEETDKRGLCFMFWNVKKTVGAPVLIALVVGKAAIDGQYMDSSDHVNHALTILRKLFGEAAVPNPVASVVTDWGKDPFTYGAYSYVAVGASGEDYDILGRPVENCLFFAGEATCKEHPDTVGGAMMSGLREAVRIIDILNTGNDYTAEVEAMEAAQRHSDSERNEVRDIENRLEAVELSNVLYKNSLDGAENFTRESLLRDMFFKAKTTAGRLYLAKELLNLPVEALKLFAGTKEGLSMLNSWILDSMGKDGTQLLRHCVRLLVLVSTDLLAVRLSGIGKTVKEKVCVHTSRDIRAIASQLVNVWIEVFRKEKASNGGLKLLRQSTTADTSKSKLASGKPPLRVHHPQAGNKGNPQISASPGSNLPPNANVKRVNAKAVKLETRTDSKLEVKLSNSQGSAGREDAKGDQDYKNVMSEEEQAAFAAAEAARAAALAAAEAYASSEAKRNTSLPLPKILSFHKFARREQYAHMDESDRRKLSGGGLLRQDCISEIDSRNCRVRDWSVDFSAACVNLDNSKMSVDNLSQRSHSNEVACQLNLREQSAESAGVDSSIFTKAWVDGSGSIGVKDYNAIDRWQSQAAAAESDFFHRTMQIRDEEDSTMNSSLPTRKHDQLANESSVSQVTVNKELVGNQPRGAERIKQAVVDYVASLLMPLYKARKIDKEGYKSIMKKTATKVMEQTTDAEKAMAVYEFLDFKRKNKIRAFVDKLIERHMAMTPVDKP